MQLYLILRRHGWATADDLQAAGARSTEEGDRRDDVRWIRSYVLSETDGSLGTACIYEADSPESAKAHAEAAGLPCDEVVPISDTVIVRPDPVGATA